MTRGRKRAHRPVHLTSRGKGAAIVQSVADYETQTKKIAFITALVEGLQDVEKGRTLGVAEAKAKFGLK